MKKYLLFTVALFFSSLSLWAQSGPVATITDATINQQATSFYVAVTVNDFDAVGKVTLTFTFSPDAIHSPDIEYLNPGIESWETFDVDDNAADTLIISATDPETESPVGLTLDDGDTLFVISFRVGTITDYAEILFYDNGTSCEFGGVGPAYTPFTDTPAGTYYINGTVELIDLDPGSVGSAQTICEADDPSAFTSIAEASGEGSITYQWQSKVNLESGVYADIDGATGATYDPDALSMDTYFRRMATATLNDVSQSAFSNEVLVTVINFEPENIFPAQTITEGSAAAIINGNPSWGEGTYTYQWQQSATGEEESFIDIESATGQTYNPGQLNADTWYRRTTTATLNGTECIEYSNVICITVINLDPGAITGEQVFCQGSDAEAFVSSLNATGDGVVTYQWQSSTTSGTEGFGDIEGAVGAGYDAGPISQDTWFRRKATATLNGVSYTEYSNVISISVVDIDPGSIGNGQYIAEGADPDALTSLAGASGDGTISYQWQVSTTGSTEGFSNIDGAVSATYDPGVLSADAWYRREATANDGGNTCSAYSDVIAVTVINFEPGTISDDQVTCQDEALLAFSSLAGASGDGTISYQWQSSTTGADEGFSDIEGEISATFDPGIVATDTWFRREAIASMGGTELSEYSNVVFATIIDLSAGSISAAQTLCEGDASSPLTSLTEASGEGSIVYQWQMSTVSATEGFNDIEGAIAAGYNPGSPSVTTWFRRQASTEVAGLTCEKYTNAVKITVNPLQKLSGIFYYHHASGDIVLDGQNITVTLYEMEDLAHEYPVGTTITDENGYYEFTDLCSETWYHIVASTNASNAGAINTTDAAQTNYWATHITPIEKVRFYASDVGTPGQCQDLCVNSTDAGRIQQNFVFGNPFDRYWTFWKAGTVIACNQTCESYPAVLLPAGNDLTQNMYGLCTGDYNRSFNPSYMKTASTSLELTHQGSRFAAAGQTIDLPVRMVNAASVVAISLILEFPVEALEVTDVIMPVENGQLDWTVKGNELRIGWNSTVPLYLTAGSELLTLRLQTLSAYNGNDPLTITLAGDPLNELADETFNVIGNAVLSIETINGNALGLDESLSEDALHISSYPNPFSDRVKFSYTLAEQSAVSLEISTHLGKTVEMRDLGLQQAGYHEIVFDALDLPSGLYIAKLTMKNTTNALMKTHKIIKN